MRLMTQAVGLALERDMNHFSIVTGGKAEETEIGTDVGSFVLSIGGILY